MITQASAKFTSSILAYFEKNGLSTMRLLETFDYPEEFLKDSHSWIPISEVERLFKSAAALTNDTQVGRSIGHQASELNAWGALDNVFRMMGNNTEVYYTRIDRFFSYFIAPAPAFQEVDRDAQSVSFIFPIDRKTYPHITDFLSATLEVLPHYAGQPSVQVKFLHFQGPVLISWENSQASLFGEEETNRVVNPKLVDQMAKLLESSERKIERLKLENQRLQDRLDAPLRASLETLAHRAAHEINNPLSFAMSNLSRFKEYFENLKKYLSEVPQTAFEELPELNAKYDIDFILKETPVMLEESLEGLNRVKGVVKQLPRLSYPEAPTTKFNGEEANVQN